MVLIPQYTQMLKSYNCLLRSLFLFNFVDLISNINIKLGEYATEAEAQQINIEKRLKTPTVGI